MKLYLAPLTETLCILLGKKLCAADLIDCAAHDYDGEAALRDCMDGGPSCAVMDGLTVVGALGWTDAGYIWSLWMDLTPEQSREIMRWTPKLIKEMAHDAARPLCNVVWEGNDRTIAWLKASHCFTFLDNQRLSYKDRVFLPFFVKPLGDLQHV